MGFKVVTELKEADLEKVMDIDRIVYAQQGYVGEFENMVNRFRANEKSFVCVVDEENDRLAGYINFFPCTTNKERPGAGLYESIRDISNVMRDDDIAPDEILPYRKTKNHLFIISIAVHPDYRDNKNVAVMLSDGWVDYLNELVDQGFPITDITATAVSPDGRKWLRNHMFTQYRKLEDGNIVYICRKKCLERLLANELYFKSYHDDIYLMLPLADNSRNHRMDELFPEDDKLLSKNNKEIKSLYEAERYIEAIKESLKYECTNDVVKELKIADLGTFTFLYTTDEYPQEEDDEEDDESAEDRENGGNAAEQDRENGGACGNEQDGGSGQSEEDDESAEGLENDGNSAEERDEEDEEKMLDAKIVVGEEEIAAVLVAHRATHMYVLTLIMPDCRYSTTRVEDQLSYDYLRIRNPDNPEEDVDLYDYLYNKYRLHRCGHGKCLVCMSNKPETELEFKHILIGEAYNSIKVDYHPKRRKLDAICEENNSQYDYYDVYQSEMVIAFILKDEEAKTTEEKIAWFQENRDDRIDTMATYSFIVEVVMFQNIALAKATTKISNALSNGGDISHDQVAELYRDFGKTVHFWEIHNFKYAGAQEEAEHVAKAFGNDELKASYYEHQEFLEHMVELKSSQIEARNGFIISIVGTVLALIQVKDFIKSAMVAFVVFLNRFYGGDQLGNGDGVNGQEVNISSLSLGIFILFLWGIAVYWILKAKKKNMRRINMRRGNAHGRRRVRKTEESEKRK